MTDRRIALEVCLTSNVQTHATESFDAHPVRQYFDRGMNVVLNTDNRLMSGTTLTDEYLLAARHHSFTFEELSAIALNGFASAFIPWKQRMTLLQRLPRDRATARARDDATRTLRPGPHRWSLAAVDRKLRHTLLGTGQLAHRIDGDEHSLWRIPGSPITVAGHAGRPSRAPERASDCLSGRLHLKVIRPPPPGCP